MCKSNWRLIACATILLGLLGLSLVYGHNHDYRPDYFYSNDGCATRICKFCGFRMEIGGHSFRRINCYERQCVCCGTIEQEEYHRQFCTITDKCLECGAENLSHIPGDRHVWENGYYSEDCRMVSRCILCGETSSSSYSSHVWVSNGCEDGIWCRKCGTWKSTGTKHIHFTLFAETVTYCIYCPYMEINLSSVNWFMLTVCLLGILWMILSFRYAVRNRGTFSLNKNILRGYRLDGGSHE